MAIEGTVLNLTFKDANDSNMVVKFNHASDEVTNAEVKALANGCVANGTLWDRGVTEKVKAELVTTSVVPIDISD